MFKIVHCDIIHNNKRLETMFSNRQPLKKKVRYNDKECRSAVKIIKKVSMCLLGKIFRGQSKGQKLSCQKGREN